MAQRRMFSPKIVSSDAFLDMPISSQALYFHLGIYADDDGFVNPRFVMRMAGASEDDLKILITKRFVLPFENGVIVIKHWKINNEIKNDRYRSTQYIEQKNKLFLKENGSYTTDSEQGTKLLKAICIQNVSKMVPQVRLGKVRLGKNTEREHSSLSYLEEISENDMKEFLDRFIATKKEIESKAEGLKLYCESKGRKYKNYKSFLLNALKRDFKEKADDNNKYKNL